MEDISIEGEIDKQTYDRNGTQAVSIETPDSIIIIFRGTEPDQMADLAADLKAWQSSSHSGLGDVHTGFKEALDHIWNALSQWVEARRSGKTVITCGHSLGGALATISARRFSADECYTYGSPRVGDSDWVDHFKTKHYRVVNNNDIVPKVPLYIMGFRHTCEPIYLSYTGKIAKMNKIQRFVDSMRGRIRAWSKLQLFDAVYDHSMDEYIRFLHKNL